MFCRPIRKIQEIPKAIWKELKVIIKVVKAIVRGIGKAIIKKAYIMKATQVICPREVLLMNIIKACSRQDKSSLKQREIAKLILQKCKCLSITTETHLTKFISLQINNIVFLQA